MDKILHYIASFVTGGQSDFLIPLSHQWHGFDVAPFLYGWAILGTLAAITLTGNLGWRLLKRRPAGVTFVFALLFATAAYAASSTLANLSAGSAISDTDLFYDVQTVGVGGVKVTGLQLKTYLGTTVQTGAGATGGTCSPGSTCTIKVQETPVVRTSGNYATTDAWKLIDYSNAADQSPTLPSAASMGAGQGFDTCSVQHSQTLTPNSGIPDTIGGGSTYVLPTGTAAAPSCIKLVSDGVSNWDVVFPQVAAANPSATAGPAAVNGSASTFMRSDAAPAVQKGSAAQFGIVEVDNSTITQSGGVIKTANTTINGTSCTPGSSCSPSATNTEPFGRPAYITGGTNWYLPYTFANLGSGSAVAANRITCFFGMVPNLVTIDTLAARITTLGSSNIQLAVYQDNGGVPGTLLGSTASIVDTGTGAVQGTIQVSSINTPIQVGPGGSAGNDKLWWCENSNDSTVVMVSLTGPASALGSAVGSATLGNLISATPSTVEAKQCAGGSCQGGSSTFGTWPADLHTSSWSDTTGTTFPAIAFRVN